MTTREIITLQVGHYSNFIGAHWWNAQESSFVYNPEDLSFPKEVNHDIFFREGENPKGEVTYTPRLVLFDLKGSLNSLKQKGTLYEIPQEEEEDIKWSGDITMHKEAAPSKNKFLKELERSEGYQEKDTPTDSIETDEESSEKENLQEEVAKRKQAGDSQKVPDDSLLDFDTMFNVWSDFLRIHFHPRTIQIIEEFQHGNEHLPFDVFGCGQEVVSGDTFINDWEDRLHFFTEECDNLQGFQVILDTHDAFGGSGTMLLQYLEDEFSFKSRLTIGVTPTVLLDDTALSRAHRVLNSALAYQKCSSLSSLFVPASLATTLWRVMGPPIQLPYLQYKPIHYHTSAILAACIDTMTYPYRQVMAPLHMCDITNNFNSLGRKMASLYTSLPFPLSAEDSFVDSLMTDTFPWLPVTPHLKNQACPSMQSVVVRGISQDRVIRPNQLSQLPAALWNCTSVEDVLQVYLHEKCPGAQNAGHVMKNPFNTGMPYPKIFQKYIGKDGLLQGMERLPTVDVGSVPVMTSLQSSPEIEGLLEELYKAAKSLDIKKHHRYIDAGLDEDEYLETLNSLMSLSRNYSSNGND
ncbi:hypothetical protein ACJMK2_043926 [Sinanodonta woodiana]|uniref:Protein misato homolog 1 n=1 Tax=Sinanodonta woodiana TaxID=1069815 RepID=A0ABD3VYF2_SINWO